MCLCICVCVFICLCVYIFMCLCACVFMCVYFCVCVHVCFYVFVYICMCVYVFVCVSCSRPAIVFPSLIRSRGTRQRQNSQPRQRNLIFKGNVMLFLLRHAREQDTHSTCNPTVWRVRVTIVVMETQHCVLFVVALCQSVLHTNCLRSLSDFSRIRIFSAGFHRRPQY
jgi:hypothetical protein